MENYLRLKTFFIGAIIAFTVSSCTTGRETTARTEIAVPQQQQTMAPQMTAELRETMSPEEVYQAFKDGHERFKRGNLRYRSLVTEIDEGAIGQHPYAIVLSCIDSRVPAETIFDKRIGDIFSTRLAGNVLNEDALGGMEFATNFAGAKLIMVMGHTKCGAIQGAAAEVEYGNLTALLNKIQPAIDRTDGNFNGEAVPSNYEYVDAIAAENVRMVIDQIRERSPELVQLEEEGRVKIVGCMYNISNGRVTFFD